jgi:ADP-dependent NAD(P)H-hydrate dehydratase / NAD(P)H-hydrate epimerase
MHRVPENAFEPLYTAAEMRAVEETYPGYPETAPELMARAGAAVAGEAMRAFPDARRFAVVCGGGANGGDGRVAVEVLRAEGRDAAETEALRDCDVVVDALFGTGFRGAPRPEAAGLIERINASGRPVVAVDLPSGIDGSTGEIEAVAVRAALTVTFHGRKVGLAVSPGRFHAGRVVVAGIGLDAHETAVRATLPGILGSVPRRGASDSKFTAGRVLVVGGSPGMTGAAVLAATAALRADAGYVTLAVPEASLAAAEVLALEPVKLGFDPASGAERLVAAAARADAVAIGPGLGRSESSRALVRELLGRLTLPVVVDADALFGLEPFVREAATVLTPHSGELARLLDTDAAWVDSHRLEAASSCAERFGAVVVLKGADTIVAAPNAEPLVSDLAPPSLATAGSGDVLTGITAAYLAKGLEAQLAAAAAATAHGLAAACVPHQSGLVASDVVAALPAALA